MDERLSWPGWLTHSGRFTQLSVTRQLHVERRTEKVHRPKTDVLPLSHATYQISEDISKKVRDRDIVAMEQ